MTQIYTIRFNLLIVLIDYKVIFGEFRVKLAEAMREISISNSNLPQQIFAHSIIIHMANRI